MLLADGEMHGERLSLGTCECIDILCFAMIHVKPRIWNLFPPWCLYVRKEQDIGSDIVLSSEQRITKC